MNKLLFYKNKLNKSLSNEEVIALLKDFRYQENKLINISSINIINFFHEISSYWTTLNSKSSTIIKENNIGFLIPWLKKSNLEKMFKQNLGKLDVLDRPNTKIQIKNFGTPKGNIVHWIAGNVPVLGIISLFQGILTKNKNIIKVPKSYMNILPELLDDISTRSFKIGNEVISGNDILSCVMVLYIDRDNSKIQSELSKIANVRIAWGGREAIESIVDLPKDIDCNDIIFGPRESLAVISKENISNLEQANDLASKLVSDIVTFDQYGCNSPHNVFVEKGSEIDIHDFSKKIAEQFEIKFKKTKNNRTNWADAYNVLVKRFIYSAKDEYDAIYSDGLEWTILVDKKNNSPNKPVFGRTIFVKEISSINDIKNVLPNRIQTVGYSIPENRLNDFIFDVANKGALRFSLLGKMSLYENPWDGVFPMHDMVRWIK